MVIPLVAASIVLSAPSLTGVTIVHGEADGETEKVPHQYKRSEVPIEIELGMERPNSGHTITLEGLAPGPDVRISYRFQTSISLSDEGPHLDLLKWKHGHTPWKQISLKDGVFPLPSVPEGIGDVFPKYDAAALRKEVEERGGERWLKVLDNEDLGGPMVLPNELQVKIEQRTAKGWTAVQKIRFTMWLGC